MGILLLLLGTPEGTRLHFLLLLQNKINVATSF